MCEKHFGSDSHGDVEVTLSLTEHVELHEPFTSYITVMNCIKNYFHFLYFTQFKTHVDGRVGNVLSGYSSLMVSKGYLE